MHSERRKKGHGTDMGGTDLRSRFERRDERLRAERKAAAPRGASPAPDPRVSGSKVANSTPKTGSGAGFDVYYEKSGGRSGGRGKRA